MSTTPQAPPTAAPTTPALPRGQRVGPAPDIATEPRPIVVCEIVDGQLVLLRSTIRDVLFVILDNSDVDLGANFYRRGELYNRTFEFPLPMTREEVADYLTASDPMPPDLRQQLTDAGMVWDGPTDVDHAAAAEVAAGHGWSEGWVHPDELDDEDDIEWEYEGGAPPPSPPAVAAPVDLLGAMQCPACTGPLFVVPGGEPAPTVRVCAKCGYLEAVPEADPTTTTE